MLHPYSRCDVTCSKSAAPNPLEPMLWQRAGDFLPTLQSRALPPPRHSFTEFCEWEATSTDSLCGCWLVVLNKLPWRFWALWQFIVSSCSVHLPALTMYEQIHWEVYRSPAWHPWSADRRCNALQAPSKKNNTVNAHFFTCKKMCIYFFYKKVNLSFDH